MIAGNGTTERLYLVARAVAPRRALIVIVEPAAAASERSGHRQPAGVISELGLARGRLTVRRLDVVSHLPAPPRVHLAR